MTRPTAAPAGMASILIVPSAGSPAQLVDAARCALDVPSHRLSYLHPPGVPAHAVDATSPAAAIAAPLRPEQHVEAFWSTTLPAAVEDAAPDLLALAYPATAAERGYFATAMTRILLDPLPLLVVCERNQRSWRRLLVPYVYGQHDRSALALARRLARRKGGSVTVLHVIEPGVATDRAGVVARDAFDCTLKVVCADDPIEAAAAEARHGYDALVLGGGTPREGSYFNLRQQRLLLVTDASLVVIHADHARGGTAPGGH